MLKTCSRRKGVNFQKKKKKKAGKSKTLTYSERKGMYQFYLKISKINEQVNTIFIFSCDVDVLLFLVKAVLNFLQFGIPRWPPFAVTKNSIEHENDNIPITA